LGCLFLFFVTFERSECGNNALMLMVIEEGMFEKYKSLDI